MVGLSATEPDLAIRVGPYVLCHLLAASDLFSIGLPPPGGIHNSVNFPVKSQVYRCMLHNLLLYRAIYGGPGIFLPKKVVIDDTSHKLSHDQYRIQHMRPEREHCREPSAN